MNTPETDTAKSASPASSPAATESGAGHQSGEHGCDGRHGYGRHRRHRRGGFLFAVLIALAAGAAGGYIGKSFAQGGPPHFGHFSMHASAAGDPARTNERIDRMVRHFAVETDASPAQQEKLAVIAKAAAADLAPLREQLKAARGQAIELMKADSVDRAALERLRATQMQLADTASKRVTQALADASDVLTPQQRQKVAGRLEQWMQRGDHMGARHG